MRWTLTIDTNEHNEPVLVDRETDLIDAQSAVGTSLKDTMDALERSTITMLAMAPSTGEVWLLMRDRASDAPACILRVLPAAGIDASDPWTKFMLHDLLDGVNGAMDMASAVQEAQRIVTDK